MAGATERNAAYHFRGEITEIQIWNKALSVSEVQEVKDLRLKGNELGLVAYYPCVEGSGNRFRGCDWEMAMMEHLLVLPSGKMLELL